MRQFAVSSSVQIERAESVLYGLAVSCNALRIAIEPHSDLPGGRPPYYGKWLDIVDHDGTCGNNCPRSYVYAREYYGTESYPHIVADLDTVLRCIGKGLVASDPPAIPHEDAWRLIPVVMSTHDPNIVPDQNPSTDAAVDLYRTKFPNVRVLTYG